MSSAVAGLIAIHISYVEYIDNWHCWKIFCREPHSDIFTWHSYVPTLLGRHVCVCVCVAFQKKLSESLIVVGIWVCCLSTWQVIWLRICLAFFRTLRVKFAPFFVLDFMKHKFHLCSPKSIFSLRVRACVCVSRQPSTPSAKCKLMMLFPFSMMLFPFSNHFSVSVRRIVKPHKR